MVCSLLNSSVEDMTTTFAPSLPTTGACRADIKFSYRFQFLAMIAPFGYSLFSHIRSFSTGLVKAAFGLQPACGLFVISSGVE
jgi:hypothetical protein